MSKNICVYSSSSDAVKKEFFEEAKNLGKLIATNGHTLIYGGASVGLMGELARSAHSDGGKVIGIIPEGLTDKGITYDKADELLVTKDLRDRKAMMEEKSDAFIALPGGFGTLEEVLEILTLRQLLFHKKPVVFINTDGFYDSLIKVFEQIYTLNFAKPDYRQMYYLAANSKDAISHIENYSPVELINKWY